MTKTKISKVAKELNVAMSTVIDFLHTQNISVDDNPNARIEESVVDILRKKFKTDQAIKETAAQVASERQTKKNESKPQPAPEPVEIKPSVEPINSPKIVGHIDLDKKGNPVAKKPEPKPQPKPEPKPQPKPAPAQAPKKKPEPKPEPVVEKKPEPKPQPKPEPKPADKKPETKPQPAHESKPEVKAEPKKETEEIFTLKSEAQAGPTLNIVGKIDLDSLNQSTRPKKKTKEERRNERNAKSC
ncbi:MAG: translation initiation factor IF-2, partial [Muribaculaceae bacterium]|nr:translation initiation factor IF-2 [Muribaculaceae bacterium]